MISNKQLKLRTDPSIADSKFVYYYIASEAGVEYIKSRGIGAAVPSINLGILKSIPIALPSIWVQRSIVSILSAYDDLIENSRRRMALLEDAARQLYREWFVRLRFPGHEHTRIIDGVPEGWRRTPFESALILQRGFDLPVQAREGAGKTTFAREFLPNEANCPVFVNADLIAAGIAPFRPQDVAFRAGRLMLEEIRRHAPEGRSFAFETTLSGLTYAHMIDR